MTHYSNGKREDKFIEWSGCFWVIALTAIVGTAVYLFAVPFMRVAYEQVDFLRVIGGF